MRCAIRAAPQFSDNEVDMKIETHGSTAPPSASEARTIQAAIGIELSKDYLDFLQRFNGAFFSDNVFGIAGGNHSGVTQAIPFEKVPYEKSLIDQTGDFGFIPVAYAEGGNYVCFATRGGDAGKIYFCDHEIPGREAFILLAGSLTEFLDLLEPFSGASVQPTREQTEQGRVWIDPDFLKQIKGSQ